MKKTLLLNYFKAATSCNPRKNTTRFNGLLALFVMVIGMGVSWGQVSYTSGTYSQNFDTLVSTSGAANTWNNNSTLTGWYLYTSASNPITSFGAETGSSGQTTFNSYGQASGNTERAIGGQGSGGTYWGSPSSGSIAGWIAIQITNSSGGTLNSFTIGFVGEQWRRENNASAHTMVLEYGFGSTFAAVTTWTAPGNNFDWVSPVIGSTTAAAVNGNVAGLVSSRGGTISGLTWTSSQTLWIRWVEKNDSGTDHALAIDNFTFSATSAPTSTTWNGTTWSNGAPTSAVDAIINGDYTETADISCKDLTINSGKTLTIGAANSLTVAGNLVNNGNLIFKSTSAGTARFASYSGAAITSSNVTVERYLPARRAWRLLTAPLKGNTNNSIYANWQGTANEGLLLFSPATYQSTTMTGYTTGGGSPNIWNYDNGWQKITNISTETMFNTNNSDTKSYLVFATGPHGSNTIAGTTTPLATTLKPVGQLITGSVAHSLTANQFKLLPNPYASPLNTAGLVTSNSGTTIWMVDPTLNTFGGYFTFNGTEWTPTTPSASDAYIQSGQGFFVKNAANTTFTIAESHKVSGNSNTWFERTTTDTSVDKIRVMLYKQINSAWQLADGVLAVNSASGNHEVDAADADKMTNFNENLLFKNGTSNLAIEYRGLPAAGTLQPMQLTGTSAQPYELRIKTENYSNSNLTPYLENTQTGVLTAIPTDGSEVIVPFTGIVATSAAPDSRFRIVYQAPLSADELNNLVVGVYPNPVHESLFTIELTNTNAPARYSLTNLLGQVVQEGSLLSLINAIPVHDLSEGMYLLQINQEGKRFTTKLMIK